MDLDYIKNDIFEALKLHTAEDASKRCLSGNFLVNTRYMPYFVLLASNVSKDVLSVVYLSERGRVKNKYLIKGSEVYESLKKPRIFRTLGMKCDAKYAILCLSTHNEIGIKNAVDAEESIRLALGKIELYDFVFIDKGKAFSFRDEFVGRIQDGRKRRD